MARNIGADWPRYNRDWRWHMKLQQWMTKDNDMPQPTRVSSKEERGWYQFFDVNNWRRERVRTPCSRRNHRF